MGDSQKNRARGQAMSADVVRGCHKEARSNIKTAQKWSVRTGLCAARFLLILSIGLARGRRVNLVASVRFK